MAGSATLLVTLASTVSIGFGAWHFFVPGLWDWYSYMDPTAIELAVAVRAINAFFSLSLVLFGVMNLALAWGPAAGRYPLVVVLAATCVLWAVRVVFQVVHPQGSTWPALQFGMLGMFVTVLACYSVALVMTLADV